MIYIDPPYGVKFGSNFQPFVRKRDVSHNDDEDLTREPEMVKAYRDTWELGLHSYLTYLRDRLLLARELLTPSGSVFVQISDENLHHVRELMDEVFGAENFVAHDRFQKTTGAVGELAAGDMRLPALVRARHRARRSTDSSIDAEERWRRGSASTTTGSNCRTERGDRLTAEETRRPAIAAAGCASLRARQPYIQRPSARHDVPIRRSKARRITPAKNVLEDDTQKGWSGSLQASASCTVGKTLSTTCDISTTFPSRRLTTSGTDTAARRSAMTSSMSFRPTRRSSQRCMLMTTDPGDLVLDPTCGSGTTAYVAEQWGRRWITIDTSRVPLALARQRLLTATFPYYELKDADARAGGRLRLQAQAEQEGRGSRRHRPARHAQEHRQQRAAGRGSARRSARESTTRSSASPGRSSSRRRFRRRSIGKATASRTPAPSRRRRTARSSSG